MPFQKGNPGKPKGAKAKITKVAAEKAEQLGVDPFEVLLLFAKGDWKALGYKSDQKVIGISPKTGKPVMGMTIEPELRQRSAKDACEYVLPKLQSIQHTGKGGKDLFQSLADVFGAAVKEHGDPADKQP